MGEWQPIECVPKDRVVLVGWHDEDDTGDPERMDSDVFDSDEEVWQRWSNNYDHARQCAPPGSSLPAERCPYQWWLDVPPLPPND